MVVYELFNSDVCVAIFVTSERRPFNATADTLKDHVLNSSMIAVIGDMDVKVKGFDVITKNREAFVGNYRTGFKLDGEARLRTELNRQLSIIASSSKKELEFFTLLAPLGRKTREVSFFRLDGVPSSLNRSGRWLSLKNGNRLIAAVKPARQSDYDDNAYDTRQLTRLLSDTRKFQYFLDTSVVVE